jgi:drug/metabolite transporter (DMT)-like permease
MKKALLLGTLSSLFFALTFVLNRQMQLSGGHWIWTSSLRFVFMLPMLWILVLPGKRYQAVLGQIREKPLYWIIWSTVGFGFFYLFLCIAAAYGPSWMIASTWQITIIAGILLTPLFRTGKHTGATRHALPVRQLAISIVIIAGVILVQYKKGAISEVKDNYLALFYIVIAAFSYPLGNRKMMAVVPDSVGTIERIFGMTLCSLPFWLILMLIGVLKNQLPSLEQIGQTLIVALSSGVIATILFFRATEMVKTDMRQLAIIESTQAGEVVFTLLLGILLFKDQLPSPIALVGILIITSGIVVNGLTQKS